MSDDEDLPARPQRRKIKRVVVMSSTSESESDDSVVPVSTRRKRLRVVSDESSDSSGSVVVARRRRPQPLRDADSSDWASDDSAPLAPASVPEQPRPASGFASDSSEGNSDKCSICLLRFKDQEVGTPGNCEHIFCLDCITEWSKNVNTCPVDRISFNTIVVRTCAGGRVIRTDPVVVAERRSSFEVLVVEDPTRCEVCGSTEGEETMLLCDGCDLGYHMQCLMPPLTEVPADQWLCPNCDDILDVIHISELDDLFTDIADLELPDGLIPLHSRFEGIRRSARNTNSNEPSTSSMSSSSPSTSSNPMSSSSSSFSQSQSDNSTPSTSRSSRVSRSSRNSNSAITRSRRTTGTTRRKKPKRRRAKTVVIEYEVEGNGKFPITKTVKKRVKRRKTRARQRQPRTAARRQHVRASVMARLAETGVTASVPEAKGVSRIAHSTRAEELTASRRRAGIPALSLFGDSHQLDYFSDDEVEAAEGSAVAVAIRPTANLFNAYRQVRRKMISIPSPPRATAAPDVLSSILESQTLLHSKRSVVSIAVDGKVDIRLSGAERTKLPVGGSADEAARKAPAHPGGRSGGWGGGWGGGYRGSYPPASASAPPPRALPPAGPARGPPGRDNDHFGGRGDDHPPYGSGPLRTPPFFDDSPFDRSRRFPPSGPRGRFSSPRPFEPPHRKDPPPRFRNFDDPLDMRTAPPPMAPRNSFGPLPEPPSFSFGAQQQRAEEDEPNELVIDTEKYDPTEPTLDDDDDDDDDEDGADEEQSPALAPAAPEDEPPPPLPSPPPPPLLPPLLPTVDTQMNMQAGVDSAVAEVLREHRGLLAPAARRDASDDDDDDGDCPNFSIYSATSVHIASGSRDQPPSPAPALPATPPDLPPEPSPSPPPASRTKEDEYNEKVSKRCPITTNTRNPIKIKLNTPSLVKRTVSLYDDEEESQATEEGSDAADATMDSAAVEGDTAEPTDDVSPDDATPIQATQAEEPEECPTPDLPESSQVTPSEPDCEPPSPDAVTTTAGDGNDDDEDDEKEEGESSVVLNGVDGSEHDDDASADELGRLADEAATEKMTESISETEDERSYTPCLDENKSKDDIEDKDKGLEGLDTEMISEDEDHEAFEDRASSPKASPTASPNASPKASSPAPPVADDVKRKKKKKKDESKKEGKDGKAKKEVPFKKLSKSGKERNYRERAKDKEEKRSKRESSASGRESRSRRERRKEKRKDLQRYDVRNVVSDKRKRVKDAFGRDVSPAGSASPAPRKNTVSPRRRSMSPRKRTISPRRRSISPRRRSVSPRRRSISPRRRSISPRKRSITPRRRSITPRRRSVTPRRRSLTPRRKSVSPRRRSISPRRRSITPRRRSITPRRKSISPRRRSVTPRRRSVSPRKKSASPAPVRARKARRSASASKGRKRRRSARSAERSPKPKAKKKARRRSPRREPKRKRRASPAPWSPPSVDSRLLSPRTPPAAPSPSPPPSLAPRRRHPRLGRRPRDLPPPSKEVFTSGDNILVSVSFKDQDESRATAGDKRKHRESRREKRKRRRRAARQGSDADAAKPVAIIDLERSPFRELTPSPKNVIVLSDSDHAEPEPRPAPAPAVEPEPFAAAASAGGGPKTPPEPAAPPVKFSLPAKPPTRAPNPLRSTSPPAEGPATPPDSPDAYDPFEPTRSASASPQPAPAPAAPSSAAASPPRALMTLEAAQKTNMSADEVIDRRPLSPIEKVMALLASTRDVSPEPLPPDREREPPAPAPLPSPKPPAALTAPPPSLTVAPSAPPVRIVLPSPTRSAAPKLFLAKPSPIKSNPVKPMQATKISRLPLPAPRRAPPADSPDMNADSPYSPGSSDFGDLFEPPGLSAGAGRGGSKRDIFDELFDKPPRKSRSSAAKVPVKFNRKKGKKTQVGVKIDEDSLKILDDLPSSAVEMQVKSKFLKKLNRQERVVEEVKLVLKPHYNKKHVTKEEYKDILRRAVPKICHNKSGEINPTKIQTLVEAYVKKFRKKHKLGLA